MGINDKNKNQTLEAVSVSWCMWRKLGISFNFISTGVAKPDNIMTILLHIVAEKVLKWKKPTSNKWLTKWLCYNYLIKTGILNKSTVEIAENIWLVPPYIH